MDIPNPYCPAPQETDSCAFVGRESLFNHINQYFLDSASPHAFLITGRSHIGKTRALLQLNERLGERYIGVYVPLKSGVIEAESQLLKLLTRGIMDTFAESHLQIIDSSENKEDQQQASKVTATWFAETFIPRVLYSIRAHRQLIFMIDDAEPLIHYWQTTGAITVLTDLLQQFDQLHMVFTANDDLETDVPALNDLIATGYIHRLENLSADAVAQFVNLSAAFVVEEDVIRLIAQLSGGVPVVLQHLCYLMHEQTYTAQHLPQTFSTEDVRALVPAMLDHVGGMYYDEWQQLTLSERLVLTAISALNYRNPLQPITGAHIEDWLIATDYPLDETAVKASLRGLEYRLMIRNDGNGPRIVGTIRQMWLTTHAQLDSAPLQDARENGGLPRWQVFVAVMLLVLVLLAALLSGRLRSELPVAPAGSPPPTVTLANP